jgi:hypothetical protein
MDELEIRNPEGSEASERPEKALEQKLEDATLEPAALVEQSGQFAQAEEIQGNFTAMVDNAAAQVQIEASLGQGQGSGRDGVAITPINLPNIAERMTAEDKSPGGEPGALRESAPVPQPVPETAEAVSYPKEPGGAVEVALPNSNEAVAGFAEKIPGGGVEAPLPISNEAVQAISEKGPGGVEAHLPASASEASKDIVAGFSTEQKTLYDQFSKDDQAALIRMVEQSQKINPGQGVGRSGGIIY